MRLNRPQLTEAIVQLRKQGLDERRFTASMASHDQALTSIDQLRDDPIGRITSVGRPLKTERECAGPNKAGAKRVRAVWRTADTWG
jgi:hypothetical protein